MKFKCRNILFTTIVSLLFLILSSCSSSETVTTSSSQEVEISSDSSQPSLEIAVKEVEPVVPEVEPVLPVTVLDHAGNTVIINSVERIIPLDGSVAEVVFALNLASTEQALVTGAVV